MMESVIRLATTANYLLLISVFCPGLAMLRFAKKGNWSIVPTMAAVILILVPATVIASSHHLLYPTWKEIHHGFAYAVWPLPGMVVLLNKWSKKGPHLGATSSGLYVLPYLALRRRKWNSAQLTGIVSIVDDGLLSKPSNSRARVFA